MNDSFIYNKPSDPSFSRDGAFGYKFPLNHHEGIEIDYIDSFEGHGGKVVSDSITHFYYIMEGQGEFIIDGHNLGVSPGQLVEIPPKHTFDYIGQMKMLLIMEPPYSPHAVHEVNY